MPLSLPASQLPEFAAPQFSLEPIEPAPRPASPSALLAVPAVGPDTRARLEAEATAMAKAEAATAEAKVIEDARLAEEVRLAAEAKAAEAEAAQVMVAAEQQQKAAAKVTAKAEAKANRMVAAKTKQKVAVETAPAPPTVGRLTLTSGKRGTTQKRGAQVVLTAASRPSRQVAAPSPATDCEAELSNGGVYLTPLQLAARAVLRPTLTP